MIHVVLNEPTKSDLVFDKITPDEFKRRMSERTILAIDLKVTDLDPMEDEIKAISVATIDDEIYILTTEVIKSIFLMDVFSNKMLLVHSGSKDISFLMAHGVAINKVFDTCLCDQVCQCNVNSVHLRYDLPSVLNRYGVPNSFRFYENGEFWREGFSVGGCNYLSLYVRHLFELRDRIIAKHNQSSNLFLAVNKLLIISSEMNTTPLKLDRNLFVDFMSDYLEEICSLEARLMDMFDTIGDSPGSISDHLFPPGELDKIVPIYDIDNDEQINAFIERCDYNPAIENAFECGMLDTFPSITVLDKYKKAVHKYNDVYLRILAQGEDDIYCHYTPITPKSLSIGCIPNFPRPTLAKKNKIPITLSLTIHPYSIIKENIFNTAEFEMRAYEIENLEIYGLALLSGDKNLMRLVHDESIEMNDLIRCLEAKGVEVPSKRSLTSFIKKLFKNAFIPTDAMLATSSIQKQYHGAMMEVIRQRYHYVVDTIVGIQTRMKQAGDALIFGEYPIKWNNHSWYKEMTDKMDEDFWRDYKIHQETKDSVYESVQRYYEETKRLASIVRNRIVDYCRLYVMAKVMDEFQKAIDESNYSFIMRFTSCDESSFILSYPAILTSALDKIEERTIDLINRRFGNDLPIIATII